MDKTKIFPMYTDATQYMCINSYGFSGDWKKVVYWVAAATLTYCVTW